MTGPTTDFWQERFDGEETGWDRGVASSQLLAWLESGAMQPCRIAVPGCGAGWEVANLQLEPIRQFARQPVQVIVWKAVLER